MATKGHRIHFIGVCGRAMSALAMELADKGWRVSGSDDGAYPPVTDRLARSAIQVFPTFGGDQVPRDADCVIVGSCFGRWIDEVDTAFKYGLPVMNFAQFIGSHLLDAKERLVIAGTNGKTTTTAMLAWILEKAGKNPDYLIGGNAHGFTSSARFRGSRYLVIEGDEYPGGHWDLRPKFASYAPTTAVLTNVSHDHPEVFSDITHVQQTFAQLADLLPRDGLLICNSDDHNSSPVLERAACRVEKVDFSEGADHRIADLKNTEDGVAFKLDDQRVRLQLFGEMNARNAAMAIRAASHSGVDPVDGAAALADFEGIAGRQEALCASDSFAHITDIAYHPEAISALLSSVRGRFPGRRILFAMQPQNAGRADSDLQRDLPHALEGADHIFMTKPVSFGGFTNPDFDCQKIAGKTASAGVKVTCVESPEDVPAAFAEEAKAGDVLVSSLGFLAAPILDALNDLGCKLN